MYISRPFQDTLLVENDGSVANFIPALFGGALLRAAGKGVKWLAQKGAQALGAAAAQPTPAASPEPESEYSGEEEELGEAFDFHAAETDDGGAIAVSSPFIGDMDEESFDHFGAAVASEYARDISSASDSFNSLDPVIMDAEDPTDERFANFKKLRKLKKMAKKSLARVGKLAGKLGPLASMVPGLGTAASLGLGAVSKFSSKQGRRGAIQQLAQEQGLPTEIPNLGFDVEDDNESADGPTFFDLAAR